MVNHDVTDITDSVSFVVAGLSIAGMMEWISNIHLASSIK